MCFIDFFNSWQTLSSIMCHFEPGGDPAGTNPGSRSSKWKTVVFNVFSYTSSAFPAITHMLNEKMKYHNNYWRN